MKPEAGAVAGAGAGMDGGAGAPIAPVAPYNIPIGDDYEDLYVEDYYGAEYEADEETEY